MHNKSIFAPMFLSLAFLSAGQSSADDFINLVPLFGDFQATAGNEIVVPNFKFSDANSDGHPEYLGVALRVYTAGTTTLLGEFPRKWFPVPALPAGCSVGGNYDNDWTVTFRRRDGAARISVGLQIEIGCWDGVEWKDIVNSGIYSVDVSNNANQPWYIKFLGLGMGGVNGVDTNGDAVNDTLLVVLAEPIAGGEDARIMTINPANGAILTNKKYELIRGE